MAELQRDPVSRSQFLTMGVVGSLMGAVLTVPPAVYVLSPVIHTNFQGRSDVPDEWVEVGSVWEVPAGSPMEYRAEFPHNQTYDLPEEETGFLVNAVLVTWRDGKLPAPLEQAREPRTLSDSEVEELSRRINVLSNHCAHLGCPTRWSPDKGLILCPCHGGEYDINGGYVAGPPPHGLFRYVYEIREDGSLHVKHEFTNGTPWVV